MLVLSPGLGRGAGHVRAGRAHFYLHDHELFRSPPDESFIDMLKQNCCLSGPHFPPAIVEVLQDYVTNYHKVRRLHLIAVDLWRPWKYNTAQAKAICLCFGWLRVPVLSGVAAKRRAVVFSLGYCHDWHACFGPIVLSFFFVWMLHGLTDQSFFRFQRHVALLWLGISNMRP